MELHKALYSKMLWLSVAVGLVFCTADVVENAGKMYSFLESIEWILSTDLRVSTDHTGYSLFYLWMGVGSCTRGANLFYTVWPVLAAMAYGWSYSNERISGIYNQMASRIGARFYYRAKYIAVFVSGGLAVGLPVLLNLLANALVCPYALIDASLGAVSNRNFLSELYYTYPWAYGLIWCGMTFLFGGTTACLCLTLGTKLRYEVMVILVPYALYIGLDALITSLRPTLLRDVEFALSPFRLLNSVPGFANPPWYLLAVLCVLNLAAFAVGYWQVVKHELV